MILFINKANFSSSFSYWHIDSSISTKKWCTYVNELFTYVQSDVGYTNETIITLISSMDNTGYCLEKFTCVCEFSKSPRTWISVFVGFLIGDKTSLPIMPKKQFRGNHDTTRISPTLNDLVWAG